MELNISADQEMLRGSTRSFLEREATSAQLRALAETQVGFERGWWSKAAELGWTSLLVPETLNGGSVSGGPLQDLAILAEEAGQFAAPGPLAVTNAVVAALTHDDEHRHGDTVARLMDGSAVATWAAYDPGGGWNPKRPKLSATRGQGYHLTGVKDRVEAGDQADLFLVLAILDGEPCEFLVPADHPGVAVERVWSLDFNRHYATVSFDNVQVDDSALVVPPSIALNVIEQQCQILSVLQAAETSGATEKVLGMTLDWSTDRYAFGRPLASYQAIKHRFANMKAWLEAMHAITAGAVLAVQERDAEAPKLARAANVFVSTRAGEIIQDCVQIHGGIGVTWEHDLHIFLRRVTVNRALYGTPEEHRRALATLMDEEGVMA